MKLTLEQWNEILEPCGYMIVARSEGKYWELYDSEGEPCYKLLCDSGDIAKILPKLLNYSKAVGELVGQKTEKSKIKDFLTSYLQ